MKKSLRNILIVFAGIALLFLVGFVWAAMAYRRPCRETVEKSGLSPALVYAVIKAESGFDERAKSRAGAVGLMQLLPSTAEFVCRLNGLEFSPEKLTEGSYNVRLGCLYLDYLLNRFSAEETALAAYNAGEGTVWEWLRDGRYSSDGEHLMHIPYPETENYVKKVLKFRKNYLIFYRERT